MSLDITKQLRALVDERFGPDYEILTEEDAAELAREPLVATGEWTKPKKLVVVRVVAGGWPPRVFDLEWDEL